MDTLIQRLGELRLLADHGRASVDSNGQAIIPSAPPESTPLTLGTWVTGFGNGMHINDQVSRAFDQNTGGFQLGVDKRLAALNGDLYIGGFLSYFNAQEIFLMEVTARPMLSAWGRTRLVESQTSTPISFSSTPNSGTILIHLR
jgi:hypothetical protein